ncbi:ADP-ribosylglycohydrolase family protein [Saccharothrix variisporea]|uniref:ADP-ribosylglycohydrolase n=1 Tax=Saccharothrix variisporea TaxID=543527 RepID=A0A495XB29_9PSEU|nr:ADP-ribosylglycohydrolase family protein [Saccharothrix variisporea]RKT69793.1 ADP-ribosylglycohydrolase [Saccharothrix variisporea]
MTRLDRALLSLDGLSVGDALGAQFFTTTPAATTPWPWTDDTQLACLLVAELRDHGEVDQDRLAASFAEHHDPYRGYGPGAVVVLRRIRDGVPWQVAARESFGGEGSCGNGAAMRVAPLGAYFADDLDAVVAQAIRSAEVTHPHPEGVAGAVAVAVAAAVDRASLFDAVLDHLDDGEVRRGVSRARTLTGPVAYAAHELGNGARTTAQDTVPFTLWVAADHHDFRDAFFACVEAGGDVDTTAAIVGGILGTPPPDWLASREPLPADLRTSRDARDFLPGTST